MTLPDSPWRLVDDFPQMQGKKQRVENRAWKREPCPPPRSGGGGPRRRGRPLAGLMTGSAPSPLRCAWEGGSPSAMRKALALPPRRVMASRSAVSLQAVGAHAVTCARNP